MKTSKILYLIISLILFFTESISYHSDVEKIDDLGGQIIKESKEVFSNFLSNFGGEHLNSSADKNFECKDIGGRRVCWCLPGYAEGKDGYCVEIYCNETRPCLNGGSCLQHLCVCLPGTSGPLCDIIHDCDRNMCDINGETRCEYNVEKQRAECHCSVYEWRFDIASRTCKSCLCTPTFHQNLNSFSNCEYQQGNKICTCTKGFAYNPKEETCDSCECGENFKWCKFDEGGEKVCTCPDDFYPHGFYPTKCVECKCGQHGKCNSNLKCNCDPGYEEYNNTCTECKCGEYGNCIFDTEGKQIGCSCRSGYEAKLGKCEMCYCGDNATCSFMGSGKICGCADGFHDVNGFCEDIDECEKHNPCGPSSTCRNTVGSYRCPCAQGFERKTIILKNFTEVETCADINECINPNTCPMSDSACLNTVGSYACVCSSGFVSRGGIGSDTFCEKTTDGSIYTIVTMMIFIVLLILLLFYFVISKRSNHEGISGFNFQVMEQKS